MKGPMAGFEQEEKDMNTISGNDLNRRNARELQGLKQDLKRELGRIEHDKRQAHGEMNKINRALARRTLRPNL